jgi:urease accessory protein UreF
LSRRVQAQSFITSPIVDILQGTHDRLFCRLFSS